MTESTKNTKTAEDKSKQAEKDTKKQIEAYIEVAKHRLGRPPTADEVMEMMSESSLGKGSEHPQAEQVVMPNEETEPEKDIGPKILNMKVYHGMKEAEDGSKEPDASKILFYESQDGSVYDCESQEWLGGRPGIVDHLQSRPIQFDETDIISAIVNGVMDDEDYEELERSGMIGENPQKLWNLTKDLRGQIEELEMAKDDDSTESLEKSEEDEYDEEEQVESDEQPYSDEPQSPSEEGESGQDQIAEIVRSAMSEALAGPYLEAAIRKIVKEEVSGGTQQRENTTEDSAEETLQE